MTFLMARTVGAAEELYGLTIGPAEPASTARIRACSHRLGL